jgi:hypothetical protein
MGDLSGVWGSRSPFVGIVAGAVVAVTVDDTATACAARPHATGVELVFRPNDRVAAASAAYPHAADVELVSARAIGSRPQVRPILMRPALNSLPRDRGYRLHGDCVVRLLPRSLAIMMTFVIIN